MSLPIHITYTHTIAEYKNEWDAFVHNQPQLCCAQLMAFEQAKVPDIVPVYVKLYIEKVLEAVIYLQLFTFNKKHINAAGSKATALLQFFLPAKLTILVCGHLFRINYTGYYFKNKANEHLIFDCIQTFVAQYGATNGMIIKDVPKPFATAAYSQKGFHFFDADVTMVITKRQYWHTFNDYLADLNKKYLQRAKKIIQSFEGITQVEFGAADILANSTIIQTLYNHVVDKQMVKLGYVNANYFYYLKKSLGAKFQFIALYKQQQIVGFYSFIFYDTTMETHFIGLNYEVNKTHQLYFNILLLGIKKMIEAGYISLELGRTAKDAKINVGATHSPIINYIKVSNIFAKLILRFLLKQYKNKDIGNLVNRHPLKEVKP